MQEFLRAILAGEGHYCITGINKQAERPVVQSFFSSIEETEKTIYKFISERRDVYFALSTFKDLNVAKPRAQNNVLWVKSLWIDLDCSPEKAESNKGYIDKDAAIEAFEKFLEKTKLPTPALVDSGGGFHAYWPLTKPLTKEQWQPLAESLRILCEEQQLFIDAQCTIDAARILRVPDTYNLKEEEPRQVKILIPPNTFYEAKELEKLLPPPPAPRVAIGAVKKEPSALTKALMGNRVTYFKNIMLKSAKGSGCAQLLNIYENQETTGYDLWRAGLSIAEHCEDAEKAIHKISERHPNYDPVETEQKAADTRGPNKGPYLCETFEKLNSGGCEGCPNKGKIKSPIVLGAEIKESEDLTITVQEITYEIPNLPEPYFRGKNGGIYRRAKDEDQILVYPHDLFVIQRIYDPNEGESAWLRLHLPQDGVKNFTVSMSNLTGGDTFRGELSKRGVLAFAKGWAEIQAYVIKAAQELQMSKRADTAHHQFGWSKNNTFVVGDVELEQGNLRYVPPTVTTSDMVDWYRPAGTLDKWKEAFNGYNRTGYEAHAFAALTAFGAPLLKITTNHKGVLLNLIHRGSGTGKTTVLRVINSVWGHPEDPMRSPDDTKASLVLRMGVLNNIPLTVDEMTNSKPEEISNFLYGITQGRGRDRMHANSNTLRINNTTWKTVGVTTSNSSFYDKLHLLKDLPQGEVFRCVEYNINPNTGISVREGSRLFDELLMENYGHAWIPYITAVQNNHEKIAQKVKKYIDRINDDLSLKPPFRFYAALGAINIVGGQVAKALGLHDYNLKDIYNFYVDTISDIKETTTDKGGDAATFVSRYILKYMAQNALIIDSVADGRSGFASRQTPRGQLLIRMEPDTKMIYIDAKHFRNECTEAQMPYREVLKDLENGQVLIKVSKKGMSKGTPLGTPPIEALQLDAIKMGVEIPDISEDVVGSD
jgi:hypothetical protein